MEELPIHRAPRDNDLASMEEFPTQRTAEEDDLAPMEVEEHSMHAAKEDLAPMEELPMPRAEEGDLAPMEELPMPRAAEEDLAPMEELPMPRAAAEEDDLVPMEETPMDRAARNGDLGEVRRLIELGISVDSVNNKGIAPLHWAAARGHSEVVELLIRNKCDVNLKYHYYTPLMLSAIVGHKVIFDRLLQCGASIGGKDEYNNATFPHWASHHGWVDVAQLLVERGECAPETTDNNGKTPLIWAAEFGKKKVATLFIQAGADINHKTITKRTPLHYSSKNGHLEFVEILLEKEGLDLNPQDCDGETPLHKASDQGRVEVIEKLMAAGADTSIKNKKGKTAFSVGIEKGRFSPKEISLFVRKGMFFDDCDHSYMFGNPVIKEHILRDVDLCTQSIINKFHYQALPTLYRNPGLAKTLPHMRKFKLNTQEMHDIENFVKFDIKTNLFFNVVNARPIALKLKCVKSLILAYPASKCQNKKFRSRS